MDDSAFEPRSRDFAARMPVSCQVRLSGLEVMADIGTLESEKGVRQPLSIDVAVSVVPPATDALSQTFDYRHVRACALELAAERIELIETFALKLARMCVAHEMVLSAEVLIGKPRAVPGCLASTSVTLSKCEA